MSAKKNPALPPARAKRQPPLLACSQYDANERADLAATPAIPANVVSGPLLGPESNWLATWQRSLSEVDQTAFTAALAEAGISMQLFWEDAAPTSLLSLLPFWRLDYYRAWFLGHGYADLFSYTRFETDGSAWQCPEWESKLDECVRGHYWHISGPRALPTTEFYHTASHGLSQLVRLISEYSQRELDPQRKPMWQALRVIIHQKREPKP